MSRKIEEPFKTALEKRGIYEPNIDYKVGHDCPDHAWLKKCGYALKTGEDCSNYVYDKETGKFVGGLNASSYGDWGSYFYTFDKDGTAYRLFMQMYEEGVIDFWRIRVYIDGQVYDYDADSGKWETYTVETKWRTCECPLK